MALPTWEKTWSITHWSALALGNQDDENRNMIMCFKDALLATGGWTVKGSSDGLTFGMDDTDRWTAYSAMTGGRWIVLENSNIGSAGKFQICIQMNASSATTESSDCYASPGGTYVSDGSTSTTVRPTATDEIDMTGNFLGLTSAQGARRFDLFYTSDDKMFRCVSSVVGATRDAYWMVEIVKDARTSMTDNWICGQLSDPTIANLSAGANTVFCNIGGVETTARFAAEGNTSGWLVEQTQYQSVDVGGDYYIQPALYLVCMDSKRVGIIGAPIDWYHTAPTLAIGTEFPSSGSSTHIVFNNIVLPWDNTTPFD